MAAAYHAGINRRNGLPVYVVNYSAQLTERKLHLRIDLRCWHWFIFGHSGRIAARAQFVKFRMPRGYTPNVSSGVFG